MQVKQYINFVLLYYDKRFYCLITLTVSSNRTLVSLFANFSNTTFPGLTPDFRATRFVSSGCELKWISASTKINNRSNNGLIILFKSRNKQSWFILWQYFHTCHQISSNSSADLFCLTCSFLSFSLILQDIYDAIILSLEFEIIRNICDWLDRREHICKNNQSF